MTKQSKNPGFPTVSLESKNFLIVRFEPSKNGLSLKDICLSSENPALVRKADLLQATLTDEKIEENCG
jgi:hypothetical protein